ncbi:MAG: tetratricopeptide repeat protein [Xenococcaceae cyanobacterium]
MGLSVEVNSDNYNTEVVEKSYEKPIIIDFFATWCGPCQILKPILEKLVKEYDFVLAKVDIDRSPELASQFSIEGVPDVRVVVKGEMMPGFVGVLPEEQLRQLLNKLNLKSNLDIELETIREAKARGDFQQAKAIFDRLFERYPENKLLVIESAKFLIDLDRLESASKILATVNVSDSEYYSHAQRLRSLIFFKEVAETPEESELAQKFSQASRLTLQEDYETALKLFLEIVKGDRKYKNDGARKAMLAIFTLLGNDHALTNEYQKQLMMTLY